MEKVNLDELEKMLDSLKGDGSIADTNKEELEKFEDLVYHTMIELISRNSQQLWLSTDSSVQLLAKSTITQCLEVLKYWDTYEEED